MILDADGFDRISNRNVDSASTGLSRETISDDLIAVDLENGSVTLLMASRDGLYYTDNDNLLPMVSVEAVLSGAAAGSTVSATLNFSKEISRTQKFKVPANYNDEPLFFALMATHEVAEKLKTGNHDFDIEFKVGNDTKTIRGNTGIINTTKSGQSDEFGQRWRHIELDRVILSDGTNARHVDQGLAAYGGAAIIRGDNSSGFYSSDGITPVDITNQPFSADWEDGDGFKYTRKSVTQTWTFTPTANQPFQLFASWVADFDRTSAAKYSITGAEAFGTTDSTTVAVNQQYIPGEIEHSNENWRSLGWFISDSTNTVSIQLSKEGGGDGVLVAQSMMYVTTQGLEKPAESFSTLEHTSTGFKLTENSGETTEFNQLGLVSKRTDSNQNQVTYDYVDVDSDGWSDELEKITRQGGFTTTFAYAGNYLDKVTDSVGRVTDYEVVSGQLTKIKDPLPAQRTSQPISTYSYDANGLLSRVSIRQHDSKSITTRIQHKSYGDSLGQYRINVTPPSQESAWSVVPMLASDGTKAGFSEIGNKQLAGPELQPRAEYAKNFGSEIWSYQVDEYGLVRAYSLTTDREANLTSIKDSVWQTERNDIGLATKSIQPAGGGGYSEDLLELTTDYSYDELEDFNLVAIERPDGSYTRYDYDSNHRVIRMTDLVNDTQTVSTEYARSSNGDIHTTTEYGFAAKISNPGDPFANVNVGTALRKTTFQYTTDPTSVNDLPGGLITHETIGISGTGATADAVTTKTDYFDVFANPAKHSQVSTVTSAFGTVSATVSQLDYDQWGNLLTSTDALGNVTNFESDALGRVIKVTSADPDGSGSRSSSVTRTFYDALGNAIRRIDARGIVTSTTIDYRNDITTSVTQTEVNDDVNQLQRQQGTQRSRIDANPGKGEVITTTSLTRGTSAESRMVTREYDANENLVKETMPTPTFDASDSSLVPTESQQAPTTVYQYDKLGNLKAKSDPRSQTKLTKFYYDPTKNTSVTVFPGTLTEFGHQPPIKYEVRNEGGQLIEAGSSIQGGYAFTDIAALLQDRTDASSPVATIDGLAATNYEYDDLGRLNKEKAPKVTI